MSNKAAIEKKVTVKELETLKMIPKDIDMIVVEDEARMTIQRQPHRPKSKFYKIIIWFRYVNGEVYNRSFESPSFRMAVKKGLEYYHMRNNQIIERKKKREKDLVWSH